MADNGARFYINQGPSLEEHTAILAALPDPPARPLPRPATGTGC